MGFGDSGFRVSLHRAERVLVFLCSASVYAPDTIKNSAQTRKAPETIKNSAQTRKERKGKENRP